MFLSRPRFLISVSRTSNAIEHSHRVSDSSDYQHYHSPLHQLTSSDPSVVPTPSDPASCRLTLASYLSPTASSSTLSLHLLQPLLIKFSGLCRCRRQLEPAPAMRTYIAMLQPGLGWAAFSPPGIVIHKHHPLSALHAFLYHLSCRV